MHPIPTLIVFIVLSFFLGIFLVWRLVRAWDVDEEKSLDLTFLTIMGALIGGRLSFVLEHLPIFIQTPLNIILIYKDPGFSFWGSFLSGFLTLYFYAKRFKVDFWQVADLASVAFLGSLIFVDFQANIIEAILLLIVFIKIWPMSTHFHIRGKIVGLVLAILGVVKLMVEPFRKQSHLSNYIVLLILIISGIGLFYRVTKRSLASDIKTGGRFGKGVVTDSKVRKMVVLALAKWWYNQKISFTWKVIGIRKSLRRFYVKSN